MTPKYVQRRRDRQAAEEAKNKPIREQARDFIAFYGAITALALGLFNLYQTYRPKSHDLEIFVSDFHVIEDKIQYGIAFYNNGDYTEVISNAASILGQKIEGYTAPLPWEQNRCFEPVVLKPKETIYVRCLTEYKISDPKHAIFKAKHDEYQMLIDFDVLSPDQGLVKERFIVGLLRKLNNGIPDFQDKANYEFVTTRRKVSFENARPRIKLGTYPIEKEFTVLNLCDKSKI